MSSRPSDAPRALPALLAGALAISTAPILVRLTEIGLTATAFWRLLLGLPLLFAWLRWERRDDPTPAVDRDDALLLAAAGACFAGDLTVWHWCIHLTTIGNATLLPNLAPIFVTLIGWIAFGARPGGRFLLGLAIAMSGALTLVGGSWAVGSDHLLGDGLGVLAALFYSGYLTLVSRVRARRSTAVVMTYSTIAGAAVLGTIALAAGERFVPETGRGVAVLLALAWFASVVGQGLIGYALAHLSAAVSSIGLLLQPAAASVLAAWLLGEPLGWRQAIAAALIVGGLLTARAAPPETTA